MTNTVMALILSLVLFSFSSCLLDRDILQFSREYFNYRNIQQLTLFTCSEQDSHVMSKYFSSMTNIWVFSPGPELRTAALESVARQDFYRQAVFLDHSCSDGNKVLFRMDLVLTDKFGFVVDEGNYDGLTELIGEGLVDLGISSLLLNKPRFQYVDYSTGYGTPSRICAIFRHPPVSGGQDALIKPFSGDLWLCTFLMWLLIASVLRILAWLQPKYADVTGEEDDDIASWSDLFLLVVGIVGEQGTSLDSRWFTWRFVFFMMLILTVLLNTYYAAIVVSTLLNQSPQTIKTAKDLVESSLHFGVEDIVYNRPYFEASQ